MKAVMLMNKNARVIYKRLTEPMKKRGYINLNHRLVNTKDDLVEIAEIFRSTQYETFRLIYMKENKIVGYESISSRVPNYVNIFERNKQGRVNTERCVYKILSRMNRLGADSYYMVHNHISGEAKASNEDLRTTAFFIKYIKGFLGHLIINNENYSWIYYDEKENTVKADKQVPINVRKANKMRKVLNEKSIYDVKILSRDDLVSVLNAIKNTLDYSIAILTDSKGQIRMILDIPNNFFNMQEEQLKGYFKNLARMSGASRVFFGTNDNETYKKALKHQMNGTFKDCICYKNEDNKIYVYEKSDLEVKSNLFDEQVRVCEDSDKYQTRENKKIRILYKEVGKEPQIMFIDNTLEAKQKLVGGLIEVVPYEDVLIICNEEGKLLNMPPNLVFEYDYIAGNCFVIGDDYKNSDFKSLTDEEILKYREDLKKRSFNFKQYERTQERLHSSKKKEEEKEK